MYNRQLESAFVRVKDKKSGRVSMVPAKTFHDKAQKELAVARRKPVLNNRMQDGVMSPNIVPAAS